MDVGIRNVGVEGMWAAFLHALQARSLYAVIVLLLGKKKIDDERE